MFAAWRKSDDGEGELGRSLVAREVASGRVPADCYGIRMGEDGLFSLHPVGKKLKAEAGSRLFWLHPGPYELLFAPHPDAPEVGVKALVQAEYQDERLGRFLTDWEGPALGVDTLTARVRQIGGPHLLPPAVSQAEIDAKGGLLARFSNDLQEFGFRCTQLTKVDLGDQVDTEAELWRRIFPETPAPAPEPATETGPEALAEAAAERRAAAELAVRLGSAPKEVRVGLPLWRIEALDRTLAATLDRELPWLARRVRRARGAVSEAESRQALRRVEDALVRNARRVALLPQLHADLPELRRAAVRLQDLRLLVQRLERQLQTPSADLLEAMESVACGMEADVRRRAGHAE